MVLHGKKLEQLKIIPIYFLHILLGRLIYIMRLMFQKFSYDLCLKILICKVSTNTNCFLLRCRKWDRKKRLKYSTSTLNVYLSTVLSRCTWYWYRLSLLHHIMIWHITHFYKHLSVGNRLFLLILAHLLSCCCALLRR